MIIIKSVCTRNDLLTETNVLLLRWDWYLFFTGKFQIPTHFISHILQRRDGFTEVFHV